jgi:hypothetical protein
MGKYVRINKDVLDDAKKVREVFEGKPPNHALQVLGFLLHETVQETLWRNELSPDDMEREMLQIAPEVYKLIPDDLYAIRLAADFLLGIGAADDPSATRTN